MVTKKGPDRIKVKSLFYFGEYMAQVTVTLEKIDIPSDSGITKAIDKALERANKIILQTAQNDHRYQSRTGNLRNATKSKRTKYGISTFIDDNQAEYGKFIHEGFKKWAPDRFIENAYSEENLQLIEKLIIEEIDKFLNK